MGIPTLFDKVTVIFETFSSLSQAALTNENFRPLGFRVDRGISENEPQRREGAKEGLTLNTNKGFFRIGFASSRLCGKKYRERILGKDVGKAASKNQHRSRRNAVLFDLCS